jgi:DNA-binding NtrC family response regulator
MKIVSQHPSQACILVADDDRSIRSSLKALLETTGYQVDTAGDGEEALRKCKEWHPDIALIDMDLPKMRGLELIGYIRGLSRKTAVVILTAHGTVAEAVNAMKLGAVDVLEKPFDPKEIELLCREILQRQKLEAAGGSVDEFLNLAELARRRNAHVEARIYLKKAMVRDVTRPEPYYELGDLYESEGDARQAAHYYYMALDAKSMFPPARDALKRLGYLDTRTNA